MELVFVSKNLHKARQMRELLRAFPHIDLLSLNQFPHYEAPSPKHATFKDCAIALAEDAAKKLNKWTLAEESGLVVPALLGAPGIRSENYAGIDATDGENCKKLLKEMVHFTEADRSAYLECAIALSGPSGLKKCSLGVCEGIISLSERGRHGFGYDAIFIKNEYEKTFAELDECVKIRVSHQRKAFERMISVIESLGK